MALKKRTSGIAGFKPDDALKELLRDSASNDLQIARAAQRQLAVAITLPMRQGILDGDIVGENGIFVTEEFDTHVQITYPLDFVVPGTEAEYAAYTIPGSGRIPEKHVEGDYMSVATYKVGNSIDFNLDYAKDARWNIVARALQVMENGFVRKSNSDAWKTLVAAAVDRNLFVYDTQAPAGFVTKRLFSLAKTQMRRSGGGNFQANNPIRLTDAFMSPEALEDMRNWDLTQIDDVTRREIFLAERDGGLANVFGVDLHELFELGENQALQNYFTSLGGSFTGSDTELIIGMCLDNEVNGSGFVNPVSMKLEIFEDDQLHRQQRQGYYGWLKHGFALTDNRNVLLMTA